VTVLVPSLLVYTDETGTERYVAVDGGVLLLEGDRVSVVTRDAVLADRLEDVAERAAAILDVRQRQERQSRAEFDELQTALVKQLARVGKQP
jgi:F-type H+-transporting ATPase subunit epsilon